MIDRMELKILSKVLSLERLIFYSIFRAIYGGLILLISIFFVTDLHYPKKLFNDIYYIFNDIFSIIVQDY
jgi:hypothetical protein